LLVHDAMVAKAESLALDQERRPGVDRPKPRALVFAEQASLTLDAGRGREPAAELGRVGERGLEPLPGAPEGRCPFLSELGVDSPVRIVESAHRQRATASV
jgi:hypothetical protein